MRAAVLGNAGTVISFRAGPEDAEVVAGEFQPGVGVQNLLHPANYHVYLRLTVKGVGSAPFSACTLSPSFF